MKVYSKSHLPVVNPLTSSFHHQRPWLIIGLANGSIELWDYRCNVRLYAWKSHDVPVRCVHFHPSRQICVSASDDGLIKIWNVGDSSATLQGILEGHRDTVRTAFFHTTEPWVISGSDDQSIRIWNWQSQTELSCLLSHGDFVLCANFHPSQLLAVSASADKTAYLWDLSFLKNGLTSHSSEHKGNTSKINILDANPFSDAQPVSILEGHTSAVNWVSFHPKRNLIISCGDDKLVRTWKYTKGSVTPDRIFNGHSAPVICALFHPSQELVLSTGKDRKLLIDDPVDPTFTKKYTRQGARFWYMSTLNDGNLVSVVKDTGVILLKFNKDRPCYCVEEDKLILINSMYQVQIQTPGKYMSLPFLSLKSMSEKGKLLHKIEYNVVDHSILVNPGSGKIYLMSLPKTPTGAVEPKNYHSFNGSLAIFTNDHQYICYNRETKKITKFTMNHIAVSELNITEDIRPITIKAFNNSETLLLSKKMLQLINIKTGQIKSYTGLSHAKNLAISHDRMFIAVICDCNILVLKSNLEYVSLSSFKVKIKSAVWDENNTLFFSTPDHIRYLFVNGNDGIIKCTSEVNYLLGVKHNYFWSINKLGQTNYTKFNSDECTFKRALINHEITKVNYLIKESNLVGKGIVHFTSSTGYPEIAAEFTQDGYERFDLFLKSNNISKALEQAEDINDPVVWRTLSVYAIEVGEMKVAEVAFQRLNDIENLSFVYLLTGNNELLKQLEKSTIGHNDTLRLFHSSIYRKDTSLRSRLLYESGSYALAYLTAKCQSENTMMSECLKLANISENDIVYP